MTCTNDTDVPGAAVPEGLVDRLVHFQQWVLPGSPIQQALKDAAAALSALPVKSSDASRLKNEAFLAKGYRIETNEKDKEMRLVFYNERGGKGTVAYMVLESPEAYEFATDVLKNYDRLEGVK